MNIKTINIGTNFQDLISVIETHKIDTLEADNGNKIFSKISETVFELVADKLKIDKSNLSFIYIIDKFDGSGISSDTSFYSVLISEFENSISCGNDFLGNNGQPVIYRSEFNTVLWTSGKAISIGFLKHIDSIEKCEALFN